MKYIIELTADAKGLQPGVDALEDMKKVSQENAEQFKKANEQIAKTTSAVDQLSKGFKETGQAAAGAFGGKALEGAAKQAESFRTQLRQSRDELVKMMQSGEVNTAQLYKMAKGAGTLKDQVGDAQKVISVLASDTFKLDAALQGIQVGAAGFQIVQGAAAAFGEENKDLQKVLVKLNGVMAITQGLQQIQNALQKESALSLGVQVAAQRAYNFVVGESVGVMRVFKIALAATGIGLAVLAVGALVANWDKFSKSVRDSFPALDGVIKFFENFKQYAAGTISGVVAGFKQVGQVLKDIFVERNFSKAIEDAKKVGSVMAEGFNKGYNDKDKELKFKASLEERKFRLDLLEAQGKDVRKQRIALAKEELKYLEKGSKEYNDKLIEIAKLKYEIKKDAAEEEAKIIKEGRDAEADYDAKWRKELNDRNDETLKQIQEYVDKHYKIIKEGREAEAEYDKKWRKEEEDRMKSYYEAEAEYDKKWKEEKQNRDKTYKEMAVALAQETADTIFTIANTRRNDEFNAQIQRLNDLKDRELANKNLTDEQKARIEERYAKQTAAIKAKQALADKQAAIAQALINGALAITRIATTVSPVTALGLPNPGYYSALVLAAATTAAQVAIISTQKIPKFAKGTEFVSGAGSETSDSIPAMLSKGERVVPAHINKLLNGIPNEMLPEMLMPSKTMISANMDYDKMAKAFSKELASNPQLMVNFDRRGFETFIKNGNTTQQVKNSRNDF